jgi:HSP20 family protein
MVEKTEPTTHWSALYDPLRNLGAKLADWVTPASEASSNDKGYDISIELPGVSDEDIELTVEDGVMTIRGEKRTQQEKKGDTWYFSERQYGAFRRSFRLPEDAEADKAKAKMEDGVLHITLPRKAPKKAGAAKKIARGSG